MSGKVALRLMNAAGGFRSLPAFMKVRFTDTALAESRKSFRTSRAINRGLLAKVAAAIEKTIASAALRPASAPVVYRGDLRAKMVGRFHYRVFDVVREDELIIRNVRSTRRQRLWEADD
jgi:hypothetical protein